MGNPLANLTLTKIAKRLIEVEEATVDAPSTGADETIDGDWNFTGAVTRNGVAVETTTGAQFKANAAENNAKAYIDALLADNPITNVRAASVANVDLSAPGSTIDGVSLVNSDRVLIAEQSTASENGIYVWSGAASAMTRAADFDTSGEITSGLIVSVAEGTVNEASIWQLVTAGAITLDTTALDFEIKAGAAAGFALDADVLHKAGTETIPGDKNFTGSLNKNGAAVETVTGSQAKADAVDTALTAEVSRATAAEATKAADSATVHKTGNETVAGIKTFSSSPVVPTPQGATDAATKGYVDTQRGTAANDADVLHLAGTETVTGAKNFTGGLNKSGQTVATDATVVHNTGGETIAGVKTFSVSPVVPDPVSAGDASPKSYVDSAVSDALADGTVTSALDTRYGQKAAANTWAGANDFTGPITEDGVGLAHVSGNETLAGTKTFSAVAKMPLPLTSDMPEYYGAVGDGVTDDAAAIQAAMSAAGQVKLTRGKTYGVGTTITVASNRKIFTPSGGYQGATIKALASYDNVGPVIALTGTASHLEAIAVDATLAASTVDCIHAQSTGFSPILRDVKTTGGHAGYVNEALEANLVHCLFRTASFAGVQNMTYDLTCYDVSTDDCQDGFNSTSGFGSSTLFHFHAIGSTRRGFSLTGADHTLMYGCHADTSGQNGFHLSGVKNITMVGCYGFQSSSTASGGTANTYSDFALTNVERIHLIGCQAGGASYTQNDVRATGTNVAVNWIGFRGLKTSISGSTDGMAFTNCSGTWDKYNGIGTGHSHLVSSDPAAGTAVANTTTETDLLNTTISADSWKTGDIYRVVVAGSAGNAASSGTLTLRLRLGGVLVSNIVMASQTTAASGKSFMFESEVDVRTGGAVSELVGMARAHHAFGASGANNSATSVVTGPDFTADQTLRVTAQWATADAANTLTKQTARVVAIRR